MFIVLVGLPGVGKSTIAQRISEELGFPMFSIDDVKRRISDPATVAAVAQGTPILDDIRQRIYDAALQDILARGPPIIIEETFHRRMFREPFFAALRKRGRVFVVLVEAPERIVLERLSSRKGHMASAATYRAFAEINEPFDAVDFRFENDGGFEKKMGMLLHALEAS